MRFRHRFEVQADLDAVLDFHRRPNRLQGQKFDPHGAYVRRFVPGLERVPERWLHHPWDMPLELQLRSGCVLGIDYPAPPVEHAWARERLLNVCSAARRRTRGQAG